LKPLTKDELLTFEEWLERTDYSAARKEELRKVFLETDGKPSRRLLRKVKAFLKDETIPEYKFPRGIYSRSDAAKITFGPLVQSVSDKLFAQDWFIKKIPVVDRPEVIYAKLYKPGSEYIFTDYTAFESAFKAILMECCENQLYIHMTSKIGGDAAKLAGLMAEIKMGNNNVIFKLFDCVIKSRRMSGEMDTSTSNGFTNLMLFLFVCSELGLSDRQIRGFVEGDDGIFRCDCNIIGFAKKLEEKFTQLGMIIKIGVTPHLERASFCGQVYHIEDKVVVTDIREQVCRFGWTNKKYVNAKVPVLKELLRAKGYSLAYQYAGCPILGLLGHKILELTEGVKVRDSIINSYDQYTREKMRTSMKAELTYREPGMATRYLVEELYGVCVDEQKDIEKSIREMTSMGPLPFRFRNEPEHWVHYYETYTVSTVDEKPVWVKAETNKLIDKMIEYKYMNESLRRRAKWVDVSV